MKTKNRLLFSSIISVAFASGIASAQTTWTKADNTTALTTSGSWTVAGVPAASGDSLLFDNTLTAYRAAGIGSGLNVVGIEQTNTLNHEFEITANGSNTLSIGTGGISVTTGARLSFGAPVVLTGSQSWSLTTGRINVKNTLTTGGNTLDVSASSGNAGILSFTGTNTLGSEVTIGTMDRVYVQSGTVTFNGTNNTNTGFLMFGGTADIASIGNLTFASSIGKGSAYVQSGATLNYTGNTFSSDKGFTRDSNGTSTIKVATAGQTLSMSGNLTTGTVTTTGGWAFGGAGNLTLTGNITNAASTTVTKNDAGTVTLSGANTYTGTTSVTAGTLALVGGSQTSPITVSSGAALGFTLGSPTISTSTVTFSGAAPKVTVSGTPVAATLMTASGVIGIPVLTPAIPGFSLAVTATGLDLVTTAAQGIKADNGDGLNLTTSWVGGIKPTSGTYLIVDNTLTANQAAAIGDDLSVLGITASSAKNLTINNTAGKTLSIGTSGIISSGAGTLAFNNATSLGGNITMASTSTGSISFGALTLTANQTWALGGTSSNNRINVTGALTTGGNTLNISSSSASQGIINFAASNTLGSEVSIGTIGSMYVQGGGVTVALTGTNNTKTGFSIFNGGTANIASMGNLTGASSIGKGNAFVAAGTTLNYTGNTFSSDKGLSGSGATTSTINVTTAGQTLSMSGAISATTAGAGGWTFGGAGNLNLSGVINNNAGTTVTKNGAGTLTLSGANAYAGATTVTAGTLALGANDVLPDLSDVSIGAATLDAATFDDTAGTLDVTAAATIRLGAGANLVFANSSGKTWAGTLDITGTFVSGSSLNFGAGGLTAGQLLQISATGFSNFALNGSGFLTATATAGYSSWASLNGAGANLSDDHDNDGVSNGVEYFIGGTTGNTTGFTPLPSVTTVAGVRSVTWVKGPGYTGVYPTDFVVETSTTLATGSWTTETLGDNVIISGSNVTYTFPAGPAKTFARLKVTGP
ncbi:MAG: toxins and related Ca2+-binding domain [Verrucomicrobiota bacterium]